jgi:hypothetical protein
MAVTTTPDKDVENINVEFVMQKSALKEMDEGKYFAQEKAKNMAAQEIADSVKEDSRDFLNDGMEIYQQQNEERAKQPSDGKLTLVDIDTAQDAKALLIEGLIGEFIKEINETLNPEDQITKTQQKQIVIDLNKEYSKAVNKTNTATSDNIARKVFEKHAPKACKQYKNASKRVKSYSQANRDNVEQQTNDPDTKFEKVNRMALRAYVSPESILNLDPDSMAYLLSRCGIFNNSSFRMQPQPTFHRTAEEEAEAAAQINKIETFLQGIK